LTANAGRKNARHANDLKVHSAAYERLYYKVCKSRQTWAYPSIITALL